MKLNCKKALYLTIVLAVVLSFFLIGSESKNKSYSERKGFKIIIPPTILYDKYKNAVFNSGVWFGEKKYLDNIEKLYEISIKTPIIAENLSLTDDLLMTKAIVYTNYNNEGIANYTKAIEILDEVIKNYSQETVAFPVNIFSGFHDFPERYYLLYFPNDTIGQCTFLKAYAYYLTNNTQKCINILETYINNEILSETYSEDDMIDFWNHPVLKKEFTVSTFENLSKEDHPFNKFTRWRSCFRPDKIMLLFLFKIYTEEQNYTKAEECRKILKKLFPKIYINLYKNIFKSFDEKDYKETCKKIKNVIFEFIKNN